MPWWRDDLTLGILTWAGVIAGLLGLGYTWREARSARLAADAARLGVDDLRRSIALADAASLSGQLERLQWMVRAGEFAAALGGFVAIRRQASDLHQLVGSRPEGAGPRTVTLRNLRAVERQLRAAADRSGSFSSSTLFKALDGLIEYFTALESEMKLGGSKGQGS